MDDGGNFLRNKPRIVVVTVLITRGNPCLQENQHGSQHSENRRPVICTPLSAAFLFFALFKGSYSKQLLSVQQHKVK